ncbi:hypothetical protein ABWW58_14225 [Sporolactobacillus sp. STCC-11]|uniref:hypothetical protein n=1 Tax=Sporolactobacillus caesalpiniae TaxID=3230362 RepID=UPI0033985908
MKRNTWLLIVLAVVIPLIILINLFVHNDRIIPILIGLLIFGSGTFFRYLTKKGLIKKTKDR